MKFKVSTIPHQYRSDYYGKGSKIGKSDLEYENIYDYKDPFISGNEAKVNINLEDYENYPNDVIVIPELSFIFSNDKSSLYLTMDKEFIDVYSDSYINNDGELIIIRNVTANN